jgi:hypothetical protein
MTKKLLPLLGLTTVVLLNCSNNDTQKQKVQNNKYPVTMSGIDSLQLRMSVDEVEKLLQVKIPLPYIDKGAFSDTFLAKYKGMDMILYLEGEERAHATLRGVETSHPSCKTASGLGAGSDKISVINDYPDNLKYIAPEYEVYPIRSKTKSAIAVMDTIESGALIFHVLNKKVSSVEVRTFYEFY